MTHSHSHSSADRPFWIFFLRSSELYHLHAAHAIIFGVAPRFLSPVKKMLRVFAMLYDFFALVIRFFSRGFKSGAVAHRESA